MYALGRGGAALAIGIIDADLLGRKRHRFPNLACEKISGYWKAEGKQVVLLKDYDHAGDYDHVYISKVFTDTPVPEWVVDDARRPENVSIGGTGFFFDKAPNLPNNIEHHMPDYDLYNDFIESCVEKERAVKKEKFDEKAFRSRFREYTDYSIGFLTRGCFRKCGFCINKKYDHVFAHSPLEEFYDPDRKKICLLDDNFLGCPRWQELLETLQATGKQFKFKQGLDERLLTDEKCKVLFSSNYDGDYTFAFDNIEDYDLIKSKLEIIRRYTKSNYIKFYVLVGYKSTDATDIENAFKRIALLMEYGATPYLMRFQNKNDTPWRRSKYAGLYIQMARWCNQQSIFKKMSFREFAVRSQELHMTEGTDCAPMKALKAFEKENPEIAKTYFDKKYKRCE